jgi:bla regulator protein blaR1
MSGPLVQAIGWALLHLLWQGVLVAAILAATLALLQRQSANVRYLASCGALLLLVILGVATAYRGYDSSVAAGVSPAEGPAGTPAPTPNALIAGLASPEPFVDSHLPQIVAIWLIGVLFLSTRLVIGWIGAHRMTTRRTHTAGAQWELALARIAAALRLRRSVRLLESAMVEVPTVIGWLRPVILLPVATLSGLSLQQIEMILAHELAHIRRHDFIVNLMQSVVETLLFYHPAVWWISRRIRVEREHCCDDLAVAVFGDPLLYARALTRFEELRLDAAQGVLAANGGSLIDRIRRLVAARAESANWSSRWAAGAALITVVAAILVAPSLPVFAQRDDQAAPASVASTQKQDPKECDKATAAPHAEVDVDSSADTDSDDDHDADVEGVVEGVREGVKGGVVGGVEGGVEGGVRVHPVVIPDVMPNIDVGKIVTNALEASSAAIAEVFGDERKMKIGASGKLTVDDLITLRRAGVTPKYIDEMRATGLGQLSLDDLVALGIQGVTPDYIRAMREAGVEIKSARTAMELRIQGVSPAFVKALADAGYNNLSPHELIKLRISGVDADFIRELSKYRAR